MDNSVNNLWKNCGKNETTLFCQTLSTSFQFKKSLNLNLKMELSTYQQVLLRRALKLII